MTSTPPHLTDEQVENFRASLVFGGATQEHEQYAFSASNDVSRETYMLVCAAFVLACRHHFGSSWSFPEVIKYVGSVRVGAPVSDDIDPDLAEELIRQALGDSVALGGSLENQAATRSILLYCLVADLDDNEAEIDRIVAEARRLADRWLDQYEQGTGVIAEREQPSGTGGGSDGGDGGSLRDWRRPPAIE